MTKLQKEMNAVLTQLLVLEGIEAGDEFYFEFGDDLRKKLQKLLPEQAVKIAKKTAKQEIKEMNGE